MPRRLRVITYAAVMGAEMRKRCVRERGAISCRFHRLGGRRRRVSSNYRACALRRCLNMPLSDAHGLRHVFYVSRSRADPLEVARILESARRHNELRQVTGALLFTGGHFAQVLEGSAPALVDTMAAITADDRHEGVKRLVEGNIAQRRFEGWTMAFVEAPGADDLLHHLLTSPEIPAERAARVMGLMFDSLSR